MHLFIYVVLPEHMVNFVHSKTLTTELIYNDTHYTQNKAGYMFHSLNIDICNSNRLIYQDTGKIPSRPVVIL